MGEYRLVGRYESAYRLRCHNPFHLLRPDFIPALIHTQAYTCSNSDPYSHTHAVTYSFSIAYHFSISHHFTFTFANTISLAFTYPYAHPHSNTDDITYHLAFPDAYGAANIDAPRYTSTAAAVIRRYDSDYCPGGYYCRGSRGNLYQTAQGTAPRTTDHPAGRNAAPTRYR